MKRVVVEKLMSVALPMVLMFWTACLCILWGWAFDSSGGSALVILAATLLSIGATARAPAALAGSLQRWFERRGRGKALRAFVQQRASSVPAGREAAAAVMTWSVGLALLGGVLSTLAIYGGALLAYALCQGMLWTPLGWTAVKLAIVFAGMAPMGLGMASLLAGARLVRRELPGPSFSALVVDWAAALAGAIALLGLLFGQGVNMLGLAAMAGFAMLLAAFGLLQQRQAQGSSRRVSAAASLRGAGPPAATVGGAALVAGILVQLRFLEDLLGLGTGDQAMAVAAMLGLLALCLNRSRRRCDAISGREQLAAGAGAVTIVIVQAALMISFANRSEAIWICVPVAAALQIPLSMLAACLLTAGQGDFMRRGGRVEQWVAPLVFGGGLGVLAYAIFASLPWGGWMLAGVAATACLAWMVVWASGRRLATAAAWAWWVPLLLASASVGLWSAVLEARARSGPLTVGVWLTSEATSAGVQDVSYLPTGKTWHSEALTEAVVQVMSGTTGRQSAVAGHRGRWWVIRGSRDDFPLQRVPPRVSMVHSTADPAAVPRRRPSSRPASRGASVDMVSGFLAEAGALPSGIWQEALVRGSERDFLQAALTGAAMERYDGAFISPLPADQPQAWRCFNYQTLRRCRGRVHDKGVVVLRTSCDGANMAAAVAVIKTFHEAVGSSWAVVQFGPQRQVDLLLVGPAEAANWPQWRSGLQAVLTDDYYRDWPTIAPISLALPGAHQANNYPIPATLESWIQSHAVK
ncbi:MAG: hypothetical protein ABFD92_02950 [Planctomycetaceae bacterium]|nr:hypothetical protein [Planctomycetaceae bacterium]